MTLQKSLVWILTHIAFVWDMLPIISVNKHALLSNVFWLNLNIVESFPLIEIQELIVQLNQEIIEQ